MKMIGNMIRNFLGENGDIILLIGSAISAVLGMLVNIIVALSVWGYLHAMFEYVLYGYIAGFIISGIFVPATLVLTCVAQSNIREGYDTQLRKIAVLIGILAILLTFFLFSFCLVYKGNGTFGF